MEPSETIRSAMIQAVETAARITCARSPRYVAVRASTDETLFLASAVTALDTVAATAVDLLKALENHAGTDLPPAAAVARAALTGTLVQLGYVTLVQPETQHGES